MDHIPTRRTLVAATLGTAIAAATGSTTPCSPPWRDRDMFVPEAIRGAFAAANPAAAATLYTHAEHFLTQQAKEDRIAWVSAELGLAKS